MARSEMIKVNNPMVAAMGGGRNEENALSVDARLNSNDNALAAIGASAEIARVQAQLVAAKRFPRDEVQSVDRILNAFSRPSLAESGLYQYQRGGTDILGLSIRAAEAIAQAWGNMDFGFKEIESKNSESTVEAYAWDLETNTRRAISFRVPHYRDTRQGRKRIEDSRDIYELVANNAARRVRACILAVIPKDVQDAAQEQINSTLAAKVDISPERIVKMVKAFGTFGVTKDNLESFIQRRIDTIQPAQMLRLMRIFNSIKDGISQPSDWFEVATPGAIGTQANPSGKKTLEQLANEARENKEVAASETDSEKKSEKVEEKVEQPEELVQEAKQKVRASASKSPFTRRSPRTEAQEAEKVVSEEKKDATPAPTESASAKLEKALEDTPISMSELVAYCNANGIPYSEELAAEYLGNLNATVNAVLDWAEQG